jgi:hypothetical protein
MRNYDQALVWLEKAQANGYDPALKELRKVKKKLR